MSKQIDNEVKHLKRITMSLTDIQFCQNLLVEAQDISVSSLVYRAIEEALVISYARPFSGNDSKSSNASGDLRQKEFKKRFTDHQRNVHKRVVLILRNNIVAHSDSSSYGVSFSISDTNGGRLLLPSQCRVKRLLSEADLEVLAENCNVIEAWLFEEQSRLKNVLPVGHYSAF